MSYELCDTPGCPNIVDTLIVNSRSPWEAWCKVCLNKRFAKERAFAELQDQAKCKPAPKPKTLRRDLVEALRSCGMDWIARKVERGGSVTIEVNIGDGFCINRASYGPDKLDRPASEMMGEMG